MTYKSESWFRNVLCRLLSGAGYMHQIIESAGTGLGIPDLFIAGNGFSAWVELKNMGDLSEQELIKIPFQPLQYRWLRDYHKAGAICYLMVAHKSGTAIFEGIDIHETYLPEEFFAHSKELTMDRLRCLCPIMRTPSYIKTGGGGGGSSYPIITLLPRDALQKEAL